MKKQVENMYEELLLKEKNGDSKLTRLISIYKGLI